MTLIPLSIEHCIFACSCTHTKCNLYFDITSTTVLSEPTLHILLTFHVPNLMTIFFSLGCLSKESVKVRDPL
jgi:hypothetical protein